MFGADTDLRIIKKKLVASAAHSIYHNRVFAGSFTDEWVLGILKTHCRRRLE
jgi:hypothetical protein